MKRWIPSPPLSIALFAVWLLLNQSLEAATLAATIVLVVQAGFEAVAHGQQGFGKALEGVLAGLGDLFLGAAAHVLHLGLGAQELVGELGVLGAQGGHLGLPVLFGGLAGVVGGGFLGGSRLLRQFAFVLDVVGHG